MGLSAATDRTRAAVRVTRRDGLTGLRSRIVRVAYRRWDAAGLDFPVLDRDIADSTRLELRVPERRPRRGTPLRVGWVCTPPSPGSGGHTTMFRMIEGLEQAGHGCTVLLYDRFGGDARAQAAVIRRCWPGVRATVRSVDDGFDDLDAVVATGWPTAHVIATRAVDPLQRLYFVQDFEPFFYPRGTEYALAEDTYRFGFQTIAIGRMVADVLKNEIGVHAEVADFSCDTDVYALRNRGDRSGVVFYAKPGVARRGFRLGMLALERFHRSHPEHAIHLFGEQPEDPPFPVVHHRGATPADLAELYNATVAGLALSFTNVSLVPEEMLACGNVPVVNDSAYGRAGLPQPTVRWANPSPEAMARELCRAVECADGPRQARDAVASVSGDNWQRAKDVVRRTIENRVYG